MKEIKYKGFTIRHDSSFYVNGKQCWGIYVEDKGVRSEDTLKEAKEWIDDNPIDDFVACVVFGEEAVEAYETGGAKGLKEHLYGIQGKGYCCKRVFSTEAEKEAYCLGICDADGGGEHLGITYKECIKANK